MEEFALDLFRKAILNQSPPQDFAFQTVQLAIKPQKQVKLVQDENQLLENILRTLLQELVLAAVQSGEEIMQYGKSIDNEDVDQGQIPRLLDIVLYLCEKEHVEGGMIFQLLEDLTEMSTMGCCKDIFGYIESKQDILGKPELFARGKLVMLRTCNQLLRRLSKANDVVFCGRIIMFLAHFFPLSERSAVNIKGVFNTSNETKYEKEAPDGSNIDFNFYKTFWSLQDFFSNPASLTPALSKWHKFTSSLTVVINTFEAQPLSDEEGNAINLEDGASNFSIKYLTSSKLMGLELKDPSFRRHVLVQCLILFDYLKAPGKNDKDLPSDTMKEDIKNFEERVKKLLGMMPPRGKDFLHSIEHILERERNWVWWKRDGCPPFEKQPIEKKPSQDGGRKRRPRWRLGNKELSQLWKWADQNPNALTDPLRVRTPSIMDYWKPLADDMDESAGIEAEYHHKNSRDKKNWVKPAAGRVQTSTSPGGNEAILVCQGWEEKSGLQVKPLGEERPEAVRRKDDHEQHRTWSKTAAVHKDGSRVSGLQFVGTVATRCHETVETHRNGGHEQGSVGTITVGRLETVAAH